MTDLIDLPFRPDGARWQRLVEVFRIIGVNVKQRVREFFEKESYDTIPHWKRDAGN